MAGTLLSTVNELSYWTYQCTGTGSATDNASYQLQVDLDGDLATTTDRTNLVYETYWNDTEAATAAGARAGRLAALGRHGRRLVDEQADHLR